MKIQRKVVMGSSQIISGFGAYKGLEFAEFSEKLREAMAAPAKVISTAIKGNYTEEQAEFLKSVDGKITSLDELKQAVSSRKDAEELLAKHEETNAFMEGEVDVALPTIARSALPQDISVAHFSFLKGLGLVTV